MGNKFFSVFGKIVLVLIILAAVGYGAYYFGVKSTDKTSNQTAQQPSNTFSPTETPTPTVDESAALISDIRTALIAEHGQDAASLNITVKTIEGDYAQGDASEQGGGGMWYAAKVNGVWKLVWDGNGAIQCSSIAPYPNFPTDILPQCWDDKTQNPIKR
jgi:hypothetical protein